MFSYDLEIYDGLAQRWYFMGNARTLLGAKINWRNLCLLGPYRAARVIEQSNGAVVWNSQPGDLGKLEK
jgi:hypothetical protein